MRRPGTGNGFVVCAQGHTHWGRLGAAGLLLRDAGSSVLQLRAPWTHEGGTWSVTGGARDAGEDAVTAALRESQEESGLDAADATPLGWSVADHGGWSYTTVVAALTPGRPRPDLHARNDESSEIRWWPDDRVADLPLHAGFAAAWPDLVEPVRPLAVVVDVANLMGSRPDGWWRDRAGAATRWWTDLMLTVSRGWPVADLPVGVDAGPLDVVTPRLRLVLEGAARDAPAPTRGATPAWAAALVTPARAPGSGDDTVVDETVAAAADGDRQVVVVTADRGLRDRIADAAPAAVVTGPGSLLRLVPAPH